VSGASSRMQVDEQRGVYAAQIVLWWGCSRMVVAASSSLVASIGSRKDCANGVQELPENYAHQADCSV
jgi:hypothetical protein